MAELNPAGRTIPLGDLGLRTPGFGGTADSLGGAAGPAAPRRRTRGRPAAIRDAGGTSRAFEDALDRAGMETTHVVDLRATPVSGMAAGVPRGRAIGGQIDSFELDVPLPRPGWEQVVLSVDDRGVTTWSFAPPVEGKGRTRRAATTRTFVIRRSEGGPAEPGRASRSLFGVVGKQVLKVIAVPIAGVLGEGVRSFLEQWERTHQRDYGIRDYLPEHYQVEAPYFDDDAARWAQLATGRTLLFVHGTFSRAHGAFNELPAETIGALRTLYDGRVIAFDHRTISDDPAENIDWLLRKIPDGLTLDLDIVCHSRGGLVARSLTERIAPMPGSRRIRVHRTALVGATNSGTILADVGHWNDLVDTLSTVLNTLGFVAADTVDLVLAFVRQIVVNAYPKLRGLACMVPGGPFLADLNSRPRGRNQYLVVASDYSPLDGQLTSYFRDFVRDQLFSQKPNDSMVPIDSVCGTTTPGEFAEVAEKCLLADSMGVEHSRYFGTPKVADKLVEWLGAGLKPPA